MKTRWQTIAIWFVCMAAGYGIIYAGEMTGVVDTFIENMLVMMGINIILAVSLNLIVGFSGQFSLGHAGFMAIGAYATGIMTQTESTFAGLIFSMVTGIVIAIVVALIVGIPTLRLKGDYLAIATMGAAEIIRLTANNLKITNGPAGLYNIPQLATWPLVYIMMCLTIIIVANFVHSKTGRAIRAVRNDELAATAMGINATKYKLMAFVMGASLAAVGGSLYASYLQSIAPSNFNIMESVSILIIVVLGGIGSITGSVIAAVVLGAIDTILQNFGSLRMVIYAVMLIVIMIAKPSGLMGRREFSIGKWLTRRAAKKQAAVAES